MARVKVYYNEDCPACPPYLEAIKKTSLNCSHTCEITSLQESPLDIIKNLQTLRELGHTISSLPFFVVSDDNHQYSYEGILSSKVIEEVLEKF